MAALSKQSPVEPNDSCSPAWPAAMTKSSDVYWEPLSLWWISPSGSGAVRPSAIVKASTTSWASWCSSIAQPTMPRWHRSRMAARWSLPSPVGNSVMSATQRRFGRSAVNTRCSRSAAGATSGRPRRQLLAGVGADEAVLTHDPRDPPTRHRHAASACQLAPHPWPPVGAARVAPHLLDHHRQLGVGRLTGLSRRGRAGGPGVEARAWHLDQGAHPLDVIDAAMVLDEAEADHRIVSRAK